MFKYNRLYWICQVVNRGDTPWNDRLRSVVSPGPLAWGFLFAGFGVQSVLVPYSGEQRGIPQFWGE